MDLSKAEENEHLDYIFQHNYNRVEQAFGRLGKKKGKFTLSISGEQGKGVHSTYKVPDSDATMEFRIAISKFAMPESLHNVDEWLRFLREHGGQKHSSAFEAFEKELQSIKNGPLDFTRNNEKITALKAYEIIAKRIVFANDIDAEAFSQELAKEGPVYPLMWQMHDNYCLDIWFFLREVHGYRKNHHIRPDPVQRKNMCIFCKTEQGIFDHVEHTLPESLGNEESFLPKGYVCSTCKMALDKLEDGISDMLPFSAALITTSNGNKKGKLPTLKTREYHMEKKSPNVVRITSHTKRDAIKPEPAEGGGYKFQMTFTGQLEAHKIARMLFKAALGAIALEKGRDTVLEPRFDIVRRYIIQGGTFPNKLVMFKQGHPAFIMQAVWQEVNGVPLVEFVILGFRFMIIIGQEPKFKLDGPVKQGVALYDLSLEKPEEKVEQFE